MPNNTVSNVNDSALPTSQLGVDGTRHEAFESPNERATETQTGNLLPLSPLDISKKNAYDTEAKRAKAATRFWQVMVYAIPTFLTIIGVLVGIYLSLFSYYLIEVSGPINSTKTEIENLKSNIDDLKLDIRELRNEKATERELGSS